jgi:hypothetical protein
MNSAGARSRRDPARPVPRPTRSRASGNRQACPDAPMRHPTGRERASIDLRQREEQPGRRTRGRKQHTPPGPKSPSWRPHKAQQIRYVGRITVHEGETDG